MYQAIASRYGKTFTWDVKVQCLGKVDDDSARTFIDGLQLPITVQEFHDSFAELYPEYFLRTKVLPGKYCLSVIFVRLIQLDSLSIGFTNVDRIVTAVMEEQHAFTMVICLMNARRIAISLRETISCLGHKKCSRTRQNYRLS